MINRKILISQNDKALKTKAVLIVSKNTLIKPLEFAKIKTIYL
jgi:hypothetical protein